ncbi:DUF1513 domain-containing protein [Paracoccus sp. p4-l81]|uniref:DUF1513 domain-containing protein n=1 Tax=Paracoccus sp. p4-l81 TaxID=3342806 RepID=UPI0035B9D054
MTPTRRRFLGAAAGAAALAALPRLTWAEAGSPACLAAAKAADGSYAVQGLTARGARLFALPLPGRGHAAAAHPTRPLAVAFARRPGSFALVLNAVTGAQAARLTPPDGRQFNGHGAFDAEGAVLMTSEVVAETSEGRIGLWATTDWRRIGEWSTGGIGPHDVKRLPDGRLVVANGGIQTDPQDRSKLNIDRMQPSLTYLGTDGTILDQVRLDPDLAQNSIRHLALLADGRVAFAMQWEGDPAETVPLLGLHRTGEAPVLADTPETEAFVMQGYAGSIAEAGGRIAITSPRGGAVMVYGSDGRWQATHRRADVCGVAADGADFIVTDGSGGFGRIAGDRLTMLGTGPDQWDNHLIAI